MQSTNLNDLSLLTLAELLASKQLDLKIVTTDEDINHINEDIFKIRKELRRRETKVVLNLESKK